MTISLYTASVPVFKQFLNSLDAVLAKAEEHATAKNIDPNVFLQARLFPDMFPLYRQVQIAANFASSVPARLAGIEVPPYETNEETFTSLHALIRSTLEFIEKFTPTQIDGKEALEITVRPGTPKEKKMSGQAYLLNYGLPHFFFHITTTYGILRHNGIEIGKRDYLGSY